jgi:hypothetical protein
MTNVPEEQHPVERLVDAVESKQRNITWPDVMINASNADELMWKGSRRITKVQRVGVSLFGLVFVLSGISLANSFHKGSWVGIPIGIGFALVGCKLLWNSVRKNDLAKVGKKDE